MGLGHGLSATKKRTRAEMTQIYKKIVPIGSTMSLLVIITLTGCPKQLPVDTSQRILIETGSALAEVDRQVSRAAERQGDEAIERAVARTERGECGADEVRGDCVVRFLREEMAVFYSLTAALEAAHGTLETWEQANDAWRASDDRPDNWNELVCSPVSTMVQTILDLLDEAGLEVPDTWRALIGKADMLCSLGMVVADSIGGDS